MLVVSYVAEPVVLDETRMGHLDAADFHDTYGEGYDLARLWREAVFAQVVRIPDTICVQFSHRSGTDLCWFSISNASGPVDGCYVSYRGADWLTGDAIYQEGEEREASTRFFDKEQNARHRLLALRFMVARVHDMVATMGSNASERPSVSAG